MHAVQVAEVAPLAPALPAAGEGLAALFTVLAWLICLSLLYVWRRTLGSMFEHLADLLDSVSLPTGFGHVRPLGFVAAGIRGADHAIEGALGAAAAATERAAVYLFHKATAGFVAVGHELAAISHAVETALLRLTTNTIPRQVHALTHVLEHELHTFRQRVAALEGALVRPLIRRVGRLEHTLEHDWEAVRREVARGRARLGKLERLTAREASRLSSLEKALGVAAFAGAVAVALNRLGLRWLRCPALGRIGRRIGCGGFGLLEDLLFGTFTALAVSDLCRFAAGMDALAQQVRPLLLELVDAEEALLGCHGATRPNALTLPPLRLPAVVDALTLT